MIEKTVAATTPVTGNWSEQKVKLKAKFSTLTDTDLNYDSGKKNEMLERIQIKLGKTKAELTDIINSL